MAPPKAIRPKAVRRPSSGSRVAPSDGFPLVAAVAEALVETVREALVVLDETFRVRTANHVLLPHVPDLCEADGGTAVSGALGLDAAQLDFRGLLERMVREKAPIQDHELAVDIERVGEKTLRVNARRVRVPGEPQPLLLLALDDITERKRAEIAVRASEVRYRRIFETAREGIWLMDAATGQLLDVNPFLEELLGYSRQEMLGKKPWDLGLYDDPAAARSRFEANLAGGFGFEQEVLLRTKAGQRVFVEAITNTYDLGGRRVTQANLRDVTERARLQEQVRQMQKLDSIGRLAGGVAHDFNNLLNIISAHVGILGRDKLESAKRAESTSSIQKAVERGTAVVRQLLTFARKTDIAFEPTDVNGVMKELASMLRETLPKQVRVSTKLAEEVPRIHADPNQLHQAILNLAVNARDAMPQGGVLTLGTDVVSGETLRNKFPEAPDGTYVELCVSDTGAGMDVDTRRRIFEPFFTTKGTKGQGLGLAVVYGIVNSHRGYVDVESEVGKGTTFRIYIEVPELQPGVDDVASRARRKSSRRPTAAVKPITGERPTILLVEDEETLLAPIREFLEEEGFEVLTALDGVAAVRVHAENADRIQAVLLDLGFRVFWRLASVSEDAGAGSGPALHRREREHRARSACGDERCRRAGFDPEALRHFRNPPGSSDWFSRADATRRRPLRARGREDVRLEQRLQAEAALRGADGHPEIAAPLHARHDVVDRKSSMAMPFSTSFQVTGVDTVASGRGRTEYTEASVLPQRFWL